MRRYRFLLFIVFALSLGMLITNYLFLPFLELTSTSDGKLSEKLLNNPLLLIAIAYSLKLVFSFIWGSFPASYIIGWLEKLFPTVEIQLAREHKLIEKYRRELITNSVSITGIVSLVLQMIFEVVRGYFGR